LTFLSVYLQTIHIEHGFGIIEIYVGLWDMKIAAHNFDLLTLGICHFRIGVSAISFIQSKGNSS